jgi:hypothetical protein
MQKLEPFVSPVANLNSATTLEYNLTNFPKWLNAITIWAIVRYVPKGRETPVQTKTCAQLFMAAFTYKNHVLWTAQNPMNEYANYDLSMQWNII